MAAKKTTRKKSAALTKRYNARKSKAAGKAAARASTAKANRDYHFDAAISERFGVDQTGHGLRPIFKEGSQGQKNEIAKHKKKAEAADRRYRRQAKKVVKKKSQIRKTK